MRLLLLHVINICLNLSIQPYSESEAGKNAGKNVVIRTPVSSFGGRMKINSKRGQLKSTIAGKKLWRGGRGKGWTGRVLYSRFTHEF